MFSLPRAGWLALPALLLLLVPFLTLAVVTHWTAFHLAWGDGDAIRVSLALGCLSMLLIVLLGTPLAWWMARSPRFSARVAEVLVLIPLLTPPLAMGILLVSAYGPYSMPGELLSRVGIDLINSPPAFVLAQIYGGLPYYIIAARAAFAGVPQAILDAGQTLGAGRWTGFWRLAVPSSVRGLAAALALAWVRVVGEFGIVMIFAYFPQGIPVKLYNNLQNDGIDAVYSLVWLLLIFTLPVPLFCLMAGRSKRLRGEGE